MSQHFINCDELGCLAKSQVQWEQSVELVGDGVRLVLALGGSNPLWQRRALASKSLPQVLRGHSPGAVS